MYAERFLARHNPMLAGVLLLMWGASTNALTDTAFYMTLAASGGPSTSVSAQESSMLDAACDVWEQEGQQEQEREAPAANSTARSTDGRGRYDRSSAKSRISHADNAAEHWRDITDNSLAGSCSEGCLRNCCQHFSQNEMYTLHEKHYGDLTWTACTAKGSGDTYSKKLPGFAYGKIHHRASQLDLGTRGYWCTSKVESVSHELWRHTFAPFCSDDDNARFSYRLEGRELCSGAARALMGCTAGCWSDMHGLGRNGAASLATYGELQKVTKQERSTRAGECTTAHSEAVIWWMDILEGWDMMPNEVPPVVKFPTGTIFEDLYSKLYHPEMELISDIPALSSASGKAPGSWFTARADALVKLSFKEFGQKVGSSVLEPAELFRLMERPNHSNFPVCNQCGENLAQRIQDVKDRAPRSVRDATKARHVVHIAKMRAERRVGEDLEREAGRSNGTRVACMDDKLGSHWNYIPMPDYGRETKGTSGRWKYRQALQGNSYAGIGNFLSLVPPMLPTGSNFGCTAFASTLYRLINKGKITKHATFCSRLTDGGPDNSGPFAPRQHCI